jgi:stage II sporulation protein D
VEYLVPKDGRLPQVVGIARTVSRIFLDKEIQSSKRVRSEVFLALLFLCSTLAGVVYCTVAEAAQIPPLVRVLVEREKQQMRIEGYDLVFANAENGALLFRENSRASVPVKCSLGGKLSFSGKDAMSGPVKVSSLGGFLRVGGKQFRDELYVYSFNGDCIVVNHVDLEKYVAGLLNSEMSAKWNLQTLMAQAVAARSYAIYQMKEASLTNYRSLASPFDLDSSVKDQVYEGAHKERYSAIRAVNETRGKVLTYQGQPIKAFYHSTCGGRTESPDRVWGVKFSYIRPVTCGFCQSSPRYQWSFQASKKELEEKLRKEGFLKGALQSMKVISRNILGRADKIEVLSATGQSKLVAATKIRNLVGVGNVRSTSFSVLTTGPADSLVFVGQGSGHGVGMCQWGAKSMGEKGYNYAQILKRYYPEAQITALY